MANTTSTPFMNLVLPVPSVQLGPLWATELNTALTSVDQHDHTPGNGKTLGSSSLTINADFPFNSYNAITLRTARFTSQGSALSLPTDLSCLYVVSGELFYNDGSGNQVQLTLNGAIDFSSSGNITGMGGTSASVSYNSGSSTFTFLSNTNTPAFMAVGPLTIGRNTVSPNTVTITPPSGLSASYTLTLPTGLPAASQYLIVSSSGQVSTSPVGPPRPTGTTVAAGGVGISTASGLQSTINTDPVFISGLTVTITTTGRPVFVGLMSDGNAQSYVQNDNAGSVSRAGGINFYRNASQIAALNLVQYGAAAGINQIQVPASSFSFIDTPTAGTYTYTAAHYAPIAANPFTQVQNIQLVVYEL